MRETLALDIPPALHWHLNEALCLPDNLDVLRDEIVREGQVLVVVDSLYNFLPGLNSA